MYKILAKLPFKSNYVHYLPSCHSTNEVAQDLLQAGAEEGTIIITDDQYAGKGQRSSKWESKPGQNLTFSLILKPVFLQPNEQFRLTVAVSLAIKEVLEDYLNKELKIKWPNDIFVGNKKIGGLLIENVLRASQFDSCIIGFGLNVNQLEFGDEFVATSLKRESNRYFALNKVFNSLIQNMAKYYFQLPEYPEALMLKQYHKALLGLGEVRQFTNKGVEFSGIITGTDEFGRLQILKGEELLVFQHKEVQMLF